MKTTLIQVPILQDLGAESLSRSLRNLDITLTPGQTVELVNGSTVVIAKVASVDSNWLTHFELVA